jgi:pyruvate decarboxylase
MEPGMDQAIYVGMAGPIRKTYTVLMEEKTMAQEIDRVIEEGVLSKLPVYIYVPMDVASVQLDAKRLETPLKVEVTNSNKDVEEEIIKSTLELIKAASAPAILGDVLSIRHGGKKFVEKLMNLTKFPTYSTPLGKGVVDETSPYFNGLYNGEGDQRAISHSRAVTDK